MSFADSMRQIASIARCVAAGWDTLGTPAACG
jgi:hypothetical protein